MPDPCLDMKMAHTNQVFFEKWIQYRLPLFQFVVTVQWSNSLILLAEGFNTFQRYLRGLHLRQKIFSIFHLPLHIDAPNTKFSSGSETKMLNKYINVEKCITI